MTSPAGGTESIEVPHRSHAVRVHERGLRLMSLGARYEVPGLGRLEIERVTQRNWSRVAAATTPDGRSWFVKQFVDRVGTEHPRGFQGELRTRDSLHDGDLPVDVVPLAAAVDEHLLLVCPRVEMVTIDSIRQATAAHDEPSARVGETMRALIEARRVPGEPDLVDVWKGLDPKNIGWSPDGHLWVFDFGPPRRMTVVEAAGQVVAAGLLSRWVARPGHHIVWPERTLIRHVCRPVAPLTTLADVERRLDQNFELRLREPQRTGALAVATRLGVQTLGRSYWRAIRHEARQMLH